MCIKGFILVLYKAVSSDFVANSISFLSLIVAIIALFFGRKKVSEVLEEYKRKKRTAVFSYHINMRIFIKRLKRLISYGQNKPMKSLYLFSREDKIQEQGKGYEKLAEKLADLSQKMLDYLSTESNQIPASNTSNESATWDALLDKLVDFLADFLLYNTDSYLSRFDNEDGIINYHTELIGVLDEMLKLINKSKDKLDNEINFNEG